MDLRPSDEQQQLVAAFAALYGNLSTSLQVSAAEPEGYVPGLWQALRETGALDMAAPEARGGWGASLLDLALVAEQHGRAVAPAPLIEAQIAVRLLSTMSGAGADEALGAALSGQRMVTLALHPAHHGRATLVPAGAIADQAIVVVGERLMLVPLGAYATAVENQGCMPLADISIADTAIELASGREAIERHAYAVNEWRVLTASALAGIAQRALEIGVDYTKERKAFGVPIGSFQGVAHKLADRATEVDGAILLTRQAAWSAEEDPERFIELASMAFGFAAETARDTTYHALHFHGGYGFMLEYAIQLYFRRARAWAAILEGPRVSYRRVGQVRFAPVGAQ